MNMPEPHHYAYTTLISDIEKGVIKIPQFQRDFVWTKEKSAKLIDSILKGFPIGTFILWKTKESLRSIRNIGGAELPSTPKGDYVHYVLDGQQRLTSLYATIKGLEIKRDNRVDRFSDIYVNLIAENDEDIVIVDVSDLPEKSYVTLMDLISGELTFLAEFPKEYHVKLTEYKKRLESYAFPAILIREVPIDIATEIFTRINVTGKPLSVFEIMVAKTFDDATNFDLSEKYDELIEKLREVDYETISSATVLQTVSCILKKECQKKEILKLDKKKFIEIWPKAIDALEMAVDYFRGTFRIPVSKLLPYNALLISFSYFFYHYGKKPSGEIKKYLGDFFWRTSLSGRYSHSLESRVAQDIRRIDTILNGELPKYDYPVNVDEEFIRNNGWFSAGRSFIKAILCVFAYHEPKSFNDNAIVNISNAWLKQANSKNYHHFFPKAYLKKQNEDPFYINHIANITIVDDHLNKREIGAKKPSVYMKRFNRENADIEQTMKSHLISQESFGVLENNYDLFFKKRCKKISRELKKRIIAQEIDREPQTLNIDDYEEEELERASIVE